MGRGYHAGYWGQFGVPEERLLGRFLDSVRLIDHALTAKGERFDWHSDFYDVRDGMISPTCYQQPRFPFWGGGQLPAAIERCGDYAESWTCDDFPILPAVWEQQAGAYRRRAEANGKQPFIVLMRNGWVADSFEQAAEEFGDALRVGDALLLRPGHPRPPSRVRLAGEDHGRVGARAHHRSARRSSAASASSATPRSSASTTSRSASGW